MYIKSVKKYNPTIRFSKFVLILMILNKVTTNWATINFIAKLYFYKFWKSIGFYFRSS